MFKGFKKALNAKDSKGSLEDDDFEVLRLKWEKLTAHVARIDKDLKSQAKLENISGPLTALSESLHTFFASDGDAAAFGKSYRSLADDVSSAFRDYAEQQADLRNMVQQYAGRLQSMKTKIKERDALQQDYHKYDKLMKGPRDAKFAQIEQRYEQARELFSRANDALVTELQQLYDNRFGEFQDSYRTLTASQYQLFNRISSIYKALTEGLKENQTAPTAKLLLVSRAPPPQQPQQQQQQQTQALPPAATAAPAPSSRGDLQQQRQPVVADVAEPRALVPGTAPGAASASAASSSSSAPASSAGSAAPPRAEPSAAATVAEPAASHASTGAASLGPLPLVAGSSPAAAAVAAPSAVPPSAGTAAPSAAAAAGGSSLAAPVPAAAPPAVPKKPALLPKPTVLRLRAAFDFAATEPGELTFSAGDVIEVFQKHGDSEWWSGSVDGGRTVGLFPSNFCEEIADTPPAPAFVLKPAQQEVPPQQQQAQRAADDALRRQAAAAAAAQQDELLRRQQQEELQRQRQEEERQAAAAQAKEETERKKREARLSMRPASSRALYTVVALFDFIDTAEPGDLPFRKGDVIEVLDDAEGDWFQGRLNSSVGLFPSNFTQKIQLPDTQGSQQQQSVAAGLQRRVAAYDFSATEPGELSLKGSTSFQ